MQMLPTIFSVVLLLAISHAQAPAWAHYDLQNHHHYKQSETGTSFKPQAKTKSRSSKPKSHSIKSSHSHSKASGSHNRITQSSLDSHADRAAHTHGNGVAHSHGKTVTHKQAKIISRKTQAFDPWKLLEFAISPAYGYTGRVSIVLQGPFRVIRANGIPDHPTGAFPNEGNPNTISEQNYEYRIPKDPQKTGFSTPLGMDPFGVAINGIPFDPGAAEWWHNDPQSGWQYEAMYLGARLGLDQNNAHVQPNGAYHYHGIPTGLVQKLQAHGKPVLIGYAADGFPIYGPFGYKNPLDPNSGIKKLKSSYRLKTSSRSTSPGPGGRPDGSFTQDFEYQKGLGDLDDCNGVYGSTPEYPKGVYHYVVTDAFPFIPRSFKGTPDESFRKRRPGGAVRTGGGSGQSRGRPDGRNGPPPGGGPDMNGGRPPFGPPPGGGDGGFRPPGRPNGTGGNDDGSGPPPRRPGAGGNDDGFGPPPRRPGGAYGDDNGFGPPPRRPGGGDDDGGFGPPPRRPGGGGDDGGFGPPPRRPGGGGDDEGFGPPPRRPGGGGDDEGPPDGPPPFGPGPQDG
jgi:hypothetical protein